jgi:hypothetical protein
MILMMSGRWRILRIERIRLMLRGGSVAGRRWRMTSVILRRIKWRLLLHERHHSWLLQRGIERGWYRRLRLMLLLLRELRCWLLRGQLMWRQLLLLLLLLLVLLLLLLLLLLVLLLVVVVL